MNEKLINGIFNNIIGFVLDGIKEEDKELVSVSYKEYLFENYADTLDADDDVNEIIAIYSNIEYKKWQKKDELSKKKILLKDQSLSKLREISNIAYKHASRKLGNVLTENEYIPALSEEQVAAYVSEMHKLYESVKDFNKPTAQMYLSEGITDFEYVLNKTENMSLRTARLK